MAIATETNLIFDKEFRLINVALQLHELLRLLQFLAFILQLVHERIPQVPESIQTLLQTFMQIFDTASRSSLNITCKTCMLHLY